MKKVCIVLFVIILAGCYSHSGVVQINKDTYMISQYGGPFRYSGGSIKVELFKEAAEYCKEMNKQMVPLSGQSTDSGFDKYASADIQFKCLSDGDPELSSVSSSDKRIELKNK